MAARQARGRKGLTMTLPVRGMSVRLMREDGGMRAALKSIGFQPEPSTLSADPAEFSFLARLIIGPSDSPGEESFDVTVCTPEWLATASRRAGGIYDARHHVVVNLDDFNQPALQAWLASRVHEAEAATWPELGQRLGRLASRFHEGGV